MRLTRGEAGGNVAAQIGTPGKLNWRRPGRRSPGPADEDAPDGSSTVGRKAELDQLLEGLETAADGHKRLLCVTGEPGIGKTTLLENFRAQLSATGIGCRAVRGRCSERLAGAEAYLPVMEILDALTRHDAQSPFTRLLRLVAPTWYVRVAPLWSTADPSFVRVMESAKAASGERMKRELAAYLAELTRNVPLALFIDDLQWADASTVELLAYLCGKEDVARLLIVVAYRPTEMSLARHPFVAVKQELVKQ
ncbi:MAG: ATP-binding protein, partial [bacterium]|nr:ATP-binding protein [bacterium]